MLIFQIYEFLAVEGRWLKKQFLPAHFQAVVFDLGAIYKYKDKELADSIARIATSNDTNLGRLLQDYELGKISFQQLKKSVEQRVNGQLPSAVVSLPDFNLLRDENLRIAVERLRAEGFRTALLTNIGFKDDSRQQLTIAIPDNLKRDFDVHVESCRVSLRKPNPRIYELTAGKLGLEPEECVYVDELPRHCRGAEIAGMKSVQIVAGDTKRTVDQLSKLFGLDLF